MIKSAAVSSPAGSGKTERLARRYIELLKAGCQPERILTITFTEKAAAEMKERIFRICRREDRKLHQLLKEKILQLRITTIHAFCFSLVRRFTLELGLEPDLQTLADPKDLWLNTVYDTLVRIAEQGETDRTFSSLLDLVTAGKMSGWLRLAGNFNRFFSQRASIERAQVRNLDSGRAVRLASSLRGMAIGHEKIAGYEQLFPDELGAETLIPLARELKRVQDIFLTSSGTARVRGESAGFKGWCEMMREYWVEVLSLADHEEFKRMFGLFRSQFLAEYDARKSRQGQVDFNDMERLAYHLLFANPEWSNILLAFDEHTDHILVDEFQDTSYTQWGIIDKLTEEWRSGQGRKTEQNIQPTIFIVGDDKQSIYLFRNAHAEVFSQAEAKLARWLGPERFESETIKTNFRSLSRIIDFTNLVFARLMKPAPGDPPWCTRYSEFTRERKNTNPGIVELLLTPDTARREAERRELDARLVANRIRSLIGQPITFDENEQPIPCTCGHITILLRNRTHLGAYERALAARGIPYLVQHGTGFYQEREVKLLMTLLAALIDPSDDFSLYALLKSPLFSLPEPVLFRIATGAGRTFFERLTEFRDVTHAGTVRQLVAWVTQVNRRPLAEIMEEIITAQNGWALFWEPSRHANIRKLLQMIETHENNGEHPLRIKVMLDALARDEDEPKATLDVRGQNAVQIMTIHNAKGLQFPVVFCPMFDYDTAPPSTDPMLIEEESDDRVTVSYLATAALRREDPVFRQYWRKLQEEEKRLFYVATTRARDALFFSGITPEERPDYPSWLTWAWDILDLRFENSRCVFSGAEKTLAVDGKPLVSILDLAETEELALKTAAAAPSPVRAARLVHVEAVSEPPRLHIQPVTRDTPSDRKRHGDDTIAFGVVMHRMLEGIARAELSPDDDKAIVQAALRWFAFEGVADELCQKHCDETVRQIAALRAQGELAIAFPQPNSYAELPFMLRRGDVICSGRMDRLILRADSADVYDYKTFPVSAGDLDALVEEYRPQMSTYISAAAALFPDRHARGFLLFTALPRVVSVPL